MCGPHIFPHRLNLVLELLVFFAGELPSSSVGAAELPASRLWHRGTPGTAGLWKRAGELPFTFYFPAH